ncbi:hypothetical protein IWZ03DRAFT_444692 [Phyllosticta citriasiana]|uniref:3-hydroxyacyl-CoA dehydrogenase n=1 Tax=Phyllosticta citriasiana TaxID=595635 RepID=A0ABR1KG72_9PEZI
MSESWTPPREYQTRPIAVIGGGVLGRRIASCWVAAGYTVNIREPSEQQRIAALKYVEENLPTYVKFTGRTPGKASGHEDLPSALQNAWLAFECVPESRQLKIDTFAELEALAPQDCILATNSSSYKSADLVGKISDVTKRRVLNTHYFMPPAMMPVELMTCGFTAPEIFPFLVERFRETGASPCVARKESSGFIFNRLWAAVKREVLTILAEGVSVPEELDGMWKQIILDPKSEPCKMMDIVGLDTVALIEEHYIKERGLPSVPVDFLRKHYLEQGKLGKKLGSKGGLIESVALQPPAPSPKLIALDIGFSGPVTNFAQGRVVEVSSDGKNLRTLFENELLPDGVDVSPSQNRIFWTCMGMPGAPDGAIYSASLDGSDRRTLVSGGVINTPKQLVIEHASQKLYFSDREGLRVMRCNYDGSDLETLILNGDSNDAAQRNDLSRWCVGITVVPQLGKFFWTQKGVPKSNTGRIFCANIATPPGQSPSARSDVHCVLEGLPEPIDLDFHAESSSLYWTDRGELPFGNSLNRIRIGASGAAVPFEGLTEARFQHQIVARKFNEAIGLRIDAANGHVYVSDLGGSLYRVNLDGSDRTRLLLDDTCTFTGIALL